jgi:hypothetical protein
MQSSGWACAYALACALAPPCWLRRKSPRRTTPWRCFKASAKRLATLPATATRSAMSSALAPSPAVDLMLFWPGRTGSATEVACSTWCHAIVLRVSARTKAAASLRIAASRPNPRSSAGPSKQAVRQMVKSAIACWWVLADLQRWRLEVPGRGGIRRPQGALHGHQAGSLPALFWCGPVARPKPLIAPGVSPRAPLGRGGPQRVSY